MTAALRILLVTLLILASGSARTMAEDASGGSGDSGGGNEDTYQAGAQSGAAIAEQIGIDPSAAMATAATGSGPGANELKNDAVNADGPPSMECDNYPDYLNLLFKENKTKGDITDLRVVRDEDLDGKADPYWERMNFDKHPISGICTTGYYSCSPGTQRGCRYYFWYVNSHGELRSRETDAPIATNDSIAVTGATKTTADHVDFMADNLGECYCINDGCRPSGAPRVLDVPKVRERALRDLATGIFIAIKKKDINLVSYGFEIVPERAYVSLSVYDTFTCGPSGGKDAASARFKKMKVDKVFDPSNETQDAIKEEEAAQRNDSQSNHSMVAEAQRKSDTREPIDNKDEYIAKTKEAETVTTQAADTGMEKNGTTGGNDGSGPGDGSGGTAYKGQSVGSGRLVASGTPVSSGFTRGSGGVTARAMKGSGAAPTPTPTPTPSPSGGGITPIGEGKKVTLGDIKGEQKDTQKPTDVTGGWNTPVTDPDHVRSVGVAKDGTIAYPDGPQKLTTTSPTTGTSTSVVLPGGRRAAAYNCQRTCNVGWQTLDLRSTPAGTPQGFLTRVYGADIEAMRYNAYLTTQEQRECLPKGECRPIVGGSVYRCSVDQADYDNYHVCGDLCESPCEPEAVDYYEYRCYLGGDVYRDPSACATACGTACNETHVMTDYTCPLSGSKFSDPSQCSVACRGTCSKVDIVASFQCATSKQVFTDWNGCVNTCLGGCPYDADAGETALSSCSCENGFVEMVGQLEGEEFARKDSPPVCSSGVRK